MTYPQDEWLKVKHNANIKCHNWMPERPLGKHQQRIERKSIKEQYEIVVKTLAHQSVKKQQKLRCRRGSINCEKMTTSIIIIMMMLSEIVKKRNDENKVEV
ncbi:unnamed protein product [Ceratitis capitata]|uniref:(Mediterranean fruit fly) hypothetical protein n=1 Tax=Ceratitis capitata TaxID=7213 RepID=A0A811UNW2_CERCA|nr:unnamed protein product [Ceratitis capitata]